LLWVAVEEGVLEVMVVLEVEQDFVGIIVYLLEEVE
jgi:hypothetical protein